MKPLLMEHHVRLECILGDLLHVKCDAIVNPSNTALWLGSGVSSAIRERGGGGIQRELEEHRTNIPHGDSVETSPGQLTNCRSIIHAALLDADDPEVRIRQGTASALRLADARGYGHVAFSAFGTGVACVKPAKAAREMLLGIRDYLAELSAKSVQTISFVLNRPDTYTAFSTLVEQVNGSVATKDLPVG